MVGELGSAGSSAQKTHLVVVKANYYTYWFMQNSGTV
jgi:hypothetical protein